MNGKSHVTTKECGNTTSSTADDTKERNYVFTFFDDTQKKVSKKSKFKQEWRFSQLVHNIQQMSVCDFRNSDHIAMSVVSPSLKPWVLFS